MRTCDEDIKSGEDPLTSEVISMPGVGRAESGSTAEAGGRCLDALVRLGASHGLWVGALIDFNTICVPSDARSAVWSLESRPRYSFSSFFSALRKRQSVP